MDLPNDRSSAQLRAYLRDEHHAEIGWLNHAIRSERLPRRSRLGRWLAARRVRRQLPAVHALPSAAPEAAPSSSTRDAEDCLHPLTEDLGLGGGAEYLRCAVCGDVIVVRGAKQWRLRSVVDGAPSASTLEDPILASPEEPY